MTENQMRTWSKWSFLGVGVLAIGTLVLCGAYADTISELRAKRRLTTATPSPPRSRFDKCQQDLRWESIHAQEKAALQSACSTIEMGKMLEEWIRSEAARRDEQDAQIEMLKLRIAALEGKK